MGPTGAAPRTYLSSRTGGTHRELLLVERKLRLERPLLDGEQEGLSPRTPPVTVTKTTPLLG